MIKVGRGRLWMACLLIAITATACYQNIDEAGNPNALSMGLPTATVTPFPTATETPLPTEEPTEELDIFVEPTPEGFSFDEGNEDADILDFETLQLTFNAPPPEDILLSDVGGPFTTATPEVVAQIDNFSLTSTVFVLQVTQTQEAAFTQTAVALGIGETPTFADFATTDPGQTFFPTPTPGFTGAPQVCIHVVQPGDNLFRMSLTYGVSVNNIAAANGITNVQLILVNQNITIPGCGTTGVYPPPTAQAQSGGVGGPSVGTSPTVGQGAGICNQHVVQQYETLFEISMRYGVSLQSIANANGIANINNITMLSTLQIPCA